MRTSNRRNLAERRPPAIRALLAALLATALLAAPARAALVHASHGPFTATLHVGTHRPQAHRPWPLTLTASYRHHPVRASVQYRFLLGGRQVGSTQFPHGQRGFSFYGAARDILEFPRRAARVPLVLRVALRAHGILIRLEYAIEIRP